MTDSPAVLTPAQRKKRNEELRNKSEARLKARGAPFFGATESDVLNMKLDMQSILPTLNNAMDEMKKAQADMKKLREEVYESKLVNSSLRDILVQKGILEKDDFSKQVESKQLNDLGLVPKGAGSLTEPGDHLLIKFRIFHEGVLVDDQTSGLMAYELGTGGLPCDPEMVGMKELETKTFTVISLFKNPAVLPHYGKEVEIEIHVARIMKKVVA